VQMWPNRPPQHFAVPDMPFAAAMFWDPVLRVSLGPPNSNIYPWQCPLYTILFGSSVTVQWTRITTSDNR